MDKTKLRDLCLISGLFTNTVALPFFFYDPRITYTILLITMTSYISYGVVNHQITAHMTDISSKIGRKSKQR